MASRRGGAFLALKNADDWREIIHAASLYSQAGIFDNPDLGVESFKGGTIKTTAGDIKRNGSPYVFKPEQEDGWGTANDVVQDSNGEHLFSHNGNNNTNNPGFGQRQNKQIPNYNYIAVRLDEDWIATTVTGQTILSIGNKSTVPKDGNISYGTSFEGDVSDYKTDSPNSATAVGEEQFFFAPSDSPFSFGRLAIPDFTYIVIDLNGHKLDRNLTGQNKTCITSQVFMLGRYARLEIFDSTATDENPGGQGIITGANSGNNTEGLVNSNKGGAFYVGLRSELVLHSGTIKGNSSIYGGCAYAPLNGTINIFDAVVTGNASKRGGVTYGANGSYTITNVFGGTFVGNAALNQNVLYSTTTSTNPKYYGESVSSSSGRFSNGWGGAFAAGENSFLNIYGGKISNNYASHYGGAIYIATNSFVKLYGGEITNNISNFSGYTSDGYTSFTGEAPVDDVINGGGAVCIVQNSGGIYINGPVQIYENYNFKGTLSSNLLDFGKMDEGLTTRASEILKIQNAVKQIIGDNKENQDLVSSNLFLADFTIEGTRNENNDGIHIYPEIKVQDYLYNDGQTAKVYVTPAAGDAGGYIMRSFKEGGWSDASSNNKDGIANGKDQVNVDGTYAYNDTKYLGDNVPAEYFYTDSGTSIYQSGDWIIIRNITEGNHVNVTWQFQQTPGTWTMFTGSGTPTGSATYNGYDQKDNVRAIYKATMNSYYIYADKYEVYDVAGENLQSEHVLGANERLIDISTNTQSSVSVVKNAMSYNFSINQDKLRSLISAFGTSDEIIDFFSIFRIQPALLTVKVKNLTVTYGDPVPQYSYECEGLVGQDNQNVVGGNIQYNCSYTSTSPVSASGYTIKASGLSAPNYTIRYVNGILTVKKKPISIKIDDKRGYIGQPLQPLTFSFDKKLLVGSDDERSLGVTLHFNGDETQPGEYKITAEISQETNYDVSISNENQYGVYKLLSETWLSGGHYSQFEKGDGSSNNPYQIESASQLAYLAYVVNNDLSNEKGTKYAECCYKQTGHINLSAYCWTPIDGFLGHFLGSCYKIDGMNVEEAENAGLFGDCRGVGEIENVYLEGVVHGEVTVGGIAALGANVHKSYFEGVLFVPNSATTGGIVGKDCTIYDCGARITINSDSIDLVLNKGETSSTYIEAVVNSSSETKTIRNMYLGSIGFSNTVWFWDENINDGYPIFKDWFWIADFEPDISIFDKLKGIGFVEA